MAITAHSSIASNWDKALDNLRIADEIRAEFDHYGDCLALDEYDCVRFNSYQVLLRTPVPDLKALQTKLEIFWGDDMYSEQAPGRWQCKIIGDIQRVRMLEAGEDIATITHMDEAELEAQRAEWVAAVTDYYDAERTLSLADLAGDVAKAEHMKENASQRVLDATAGSLLGVALKLHVLWEGDRSYELERDACEAILRDVRTLAGRGRQPN